MKINSKFNINDLVKCKYDTELLEKNIGALMIMEVHTQSCYAGTQVFYLCRQIVGKKESDRWETPKKEYWIIGHGATNESRVAWGKYREDELVAISKEAKEIIENAGKLEKL